MMPPITMCVTLFDNETEESRKRSQKSLLWLMEALVKCNELWLVTHPETPKLYEAGVKYAPEFGVENWQDVPHIIEGGEGDCEDLACWRIAELRVIGGIKASPKISWREVNGSLRYHALVRWPDGRTEDPSAALGMNGVMVNKPVFVSV
jgi:hypothetical protein